MINKQRVRRIRGFLYICILLLIYVPIILMIYTSFKTLGFLGDLRTVLNNIPAIVSDSVPAPGDASPDESSVTEQSVDGEAPVAEHLDADADEMDANAVQTPEEGGRSTTNDYLPSSHPGLYFETVSRRNPPQENTLYLTVDNTPSSQAEDLLAVLRKHDVQATFFVWWNDAMESGNAEFYRSVVSGGHQIGIRPQFSTSTLSETYASVDSFLDVFQEIFDSVQQATGVSPRLYRLPGGSVNPQNQQRQSLLGEIKAELDQRGFLQYDWSVSAEDAVDPPLTTQQVLRNLEDSIDETSHIVILAHDGTGSLSTAEALDAFITKYKAAGYSFGVLDDDTEPVSFLN